MSAAPFFLHVGLPRTATTVMQRDVFPHLPGLCFLGKPWDNRALAGSFNPLEIIRKGTPRLADRSQDGAESQALRAVLPALVKALKVNNQFKRPEKSREVVRVLSHCMQELRQGLPGLALMYSDESLIESVAGLSSDNAHGAAVPLEQLATVKALDGVTVLLVLRDPFEYLRASWYKNNEFQYQYKLAPISFDAWVRKQTALCVRKPSASRIFQAMQKSFARHMRSYCRDVVITTYEQLQQAEDLMATLTGGKLKSPGIALKNLPRENNSFRNQAVVDFMLSAPGVPQGIGMTDYVKTFEGTLRHYELFDILQSDLLERASVAT